MDGKSRIVQSALCGSRLARAGVPAPLERQFTKRIGHAVAPLACRTGRNQTLRAGISKMKPDCAEKIAEAMQQYSMDLSAEACPSTSGVARTKSNCLPKTLHMLNWRNPQIPIFYLSQSCCIVGDLAISVLTKAFAAWSAEAARTWLL